MTTSEATGQMDDAQALSISELQKARRAHRWVLRLWRNWLTIALVILSLYVGLSFAAPILMKMGYLGAANVIYTLYSPMCHQFAFRSWFLFGDQIAYPLKAAGSSLTPFETYASQDSHFDGVDLNNWVELQVAARSFRGNRQMGYKTALCERDVSIYGAMVLAALVFRFRRVRNRLRPAPLWLYLILGLMPIGLDGFSQLLSYTPFQFWPVRETLPSYRLLTGALFGTMNVWLAFPYLEMTMHEALEAVEARLQTVEQRLAALQAEH